MKSRKEQIQDHYAAIIRELIARRQLTAEDAIRCLQETGFEADFERHPDAYLHIMPGELAEEVIHHNHPFWRASPTVVRH